LREGLPLAQAVIDAGAGCGSARCLLTALAVMVGAAVIPAGPDLPGSRPLADGRAKSRRCSSVVFAVPLFYYMAHSGKPL